MDLIKNTPGSRIEQVRGLIEPVYRYHLARCENYLEAQNFTTSTFLNAVSGIDTHTPGNQQELAIWIMRIARTQQAAGRRQPAFRHAHQENPDSPQPSATPGRSDVDGAASFFEENDQPSQDEILLRDQMVHLSRSWKEFPRQKADALALHFFCGLSLADIAKILKKKEVEVKRLVAHQQPFEKELVSLAKSVHPDKDFITGLLVTLEKEVNGQHSSVKRRVTPTINSLNSSWQSILSSGSRTAQVGLIAAALVAGFFVVMHQTATSSPALPTPTPAVQAATPTPSNKLNSKGILIPPSGSYCQQWQSILAGFTGQDIALSLEPYHNPAQSATADNGIGCTLSATVTNYNRETAWMILEKVSALLVNNQFSQGNISNRIIGLDGSSYFGPGCVGVERTFTSSNYSANLSISWCPYSSNSQNRAMATPTGTTPFLSGNQRATLLGGPFNLKLVLTSQTIEALVNNFFTKWADENSQVLDYLAPQATKYYPSLDALNELAEIKPVPGQAIHFNWQVLTNSGKDLILEVTASQINQAGDTVAISHPFQMEWSLFSYGWKVQYIITTSLFP